jgi:hypothetical protein
MDTQGQDDQRDVEERDVEKYFYCQSVKDFYSPSAKRTIQRLIAKYLVQNRICVTELLHRTDMIGRLENSGMVVQHAIQKLAVARAADDGTSVVETIRQLNALTSQVAFHIYQDNRANAFSDIRLEKFAELAEFLCKQQGGGYLLEGAICRYIYDAKNWGEKVTRLAELLQVTIETPAGRYCHVIIDEMISEIFRFPTACQELVDAKEALDDILLSLIDLICGAIQTKEKSACLPLLSGFFSRNQLPSTRVSVAKWIMAELSATKRLHPGFIDDELRSFRRVAEKALQATGEFLKLEDLQPVLETRSSRYLTPANLSERLSRIDSPDERVEWLLFVDNCIFGERNVARLAEMVKQICQSAKFANHFQLSRYPVVSRLQRLIALSTAVSNSGFVADVRNEIMGILDSTAYDIAMQSKLFESIEAMPVGPVEKAVTLMRLYTYGSFTEGKFSAKAREVLVAYLSWPGFLTAYVANIAKHKGGKVDVAVAIEDLKTRLERIGISPDLCLRSIA